MSEQIQEAAQPPVVRPGGEDERRALIWLVDVRRNGGPLERKFAATVIETLAWFETVTTGGRGAAASKTVPAPSEGET